MLVKQSGMRGVCGVKFSRFSAPLVGSSGESCVAEKTKRQRDKGTKSQKDKERKGQRVKKSKSQRDEGTKRLRDKGTKRGRDKETKGLKSQRDKVIRRKRGKDKNQENPLKSMAAAPLL